MQYVLCALSSSRKAHWGISLRTVSWGLWAVFPIWHIRPLPCSVDLEPDCRFPNSWWISRTQKHVFRGEGIRLAAFKCVIGELSSQVPNASLVSLHLWGKSDIIQAGFLDILHIVGQVWKARKITQFQSYLLCSSTYLSKLRATVIGMNSWKQVKCSYQLGLFILVKKSKVFTSTKKWYNIAP